MKRVNEEVKRESLLKELCGEDAKLYDCLASFLYENPEPVISKEDLSTLADQAEKTGNYGFALDKAIFEAAQKPGEREKYLTLIRTLASKSVPGIEKEIEAAEKAGFSSKAASLRSKAEHQRLLNDRTEDVINIASTFYLEKLANLGANAKREEREQERKVVEREELRINMQEKDKREARKKERRGLGLRKRREVKKQDRMEQQAAAERKETREKERAAVEKENIEINEQEKKDRESRRKERM
ncbi:MAG: hypothetical protein JW852_05860 [Spirochaetales bacterium]|nr:hypothetical protein [Spirochaetales bacterium]